MTRVAEQDLARRFATRAVHAGYVGDPLSGAVMGPIYQTSTYIQEGLGRHKGYEYARTRNPTREALERNVAALEGGVHGFAFGSGLAALDAVMKLLSAGDHVVSGENVYGGSHRQMTHIWSRLGLTFTFVDGGDTRAVAAAVTPNTKIVYAETPTNPMMRLCDLAATGEIARTAKALFVVDNTFATPYFQQPLQFGADIAATISPSGSDSFRTRRAQSPGRSTAGSRCAAPRRWHCGCASTTRMDGASPNGWRSIPGSSACTIRVCGPTRSTSSPRVR